MEEKQESRRIEKTWREQDTEKGRDKDRRKEK